MKKDRVANRGPNEDVLPDYRFDFRKAKPNRFAVRPRRGTRAVVLGPDVAAVFPTSESVNAVHRASIATIPPRRAG
jgi:hypothetical protein